MIMAHQRHLQFQGLLPAHVLFHPNFNQGTQTTVKFAKRIQVSVRCSGQSTGGMGRAETIRESPLLHTQDRARGPRGRQHFEMREIKGFKRTLSSSLNKKLEHVMLSEGLSYLEAQVVSCRLSQTWESQILERHVGMGAERSQRSSALHRASRADRQSPFTASCGQESQSVRKTHQHHGSGIVPSPMLIQSLFGAWSPALN